ncbi:MAG: LysM peptidoglycan-binding domain-containing protein [Nanoarchaeota archaeon]
MPIVQREQTTPQTIDLGGLLITTGRYQTTYKITVESGDSLDTISAAVGVSPQELFHANSNLLGDKYPPVLVKDQVLEYSTKPHRGMEILV